MREHIDDIRACYNDGLIEDPELGGRIAVAFTIATDGRTESVRAEVGHQSTTLPSRPVVHCVLQAVDRWTFPAPQGGEVEVVYPFVLEPG